MNGAQIAFIGRVTRPGVFKYASTGTAMLRVGVMIDDSKRKEDDPPDFAEVTIWGETAEGLTGRLVKGTDLYCEGRAKARAWNGQDGQARASLDVSAWKVEILGAIGRRAPRRQGDQGPVHTQRMPEAVAIHGRDTRQRLGMDEPDDKVPD